VAAPVAIVTGAARGIGRACAAALHGKGFDVVGVDLGAFDFPEGKAVQADISRNGEHQKIVDAAGGRIDCLVNNAGVQVEIRGDLLEVGEASFDRLIGVNLRGTFFLTQAVARRMLAAPDKEGFRSIITISSVNAFMAGTNRGEYCMSKAALTMMVKLFGVRLAEAGIRCYEVRPGIIRTDMTKPAAARYDKLIAEGVAPIRRWGEPGDVARAVAMLASGELPYSTGEALHVDGGLHIQSL
jgi:NAD(P)-dependent dehydrogenase (short-subunit alcohol dehydrogenase family)